MCGPSKFALDIWISAVGAEETRQGSQNSLQNKPDSKTQATLQRRLAATAPGGFSRSGPGEDSGRAPDLVGKDRSYGSWWMVEIFYGLNVKNSNF